MALDAGHRGGASQGSDHHLQRVPVRVIYGALPPEVRRREAERFSSGESHILVATDAIGMGLNLPTLTPFRSA